MDIVPKDLDLLGKYIQWRWSRYSKEYAYGDKEVPEY